MKGQMLDEMKEKPIELCHFECVTEDAVEESQDLVLFEGEPKPKISKQLFKEAFENHCLRCKELTDDVLVEFLPNIFLGKESSNEAWEKLGSVYCQHGFDVYHSDEYFEVYPIDTKQEKAYVLAVEYGSIIDDVMVFDKEDLAEQRYIDIVNGQFGTEFDSIADAQERMSKYYNNEQAENGVRYLVTTINE